MAFSASPLPPAGTVSSLPLQRQKGADTENQQQQQAKLSLANPSLSSWKAIVETCSRNSSSTEFWRYDSPVSLANLQTCYVHRNYDDDDAGVHIRTHLATADDDTPTPHDRSRHRRILHEDGDIRTLHVYAEISDGATLTHLDDINDGADILQPQVCDHDDVSLEARQKQKCNPLGSHVHPLVWSSCQENRLLQTLCDQGHLKKAMDALCHMDTTPSTNIYLSLLKLCNKTKSLAHVKDVCNHLVQRRAELTGFLGDFLVVTLAKCGAVEDAREIANRLVCRTVFSWTAIISAYVDRGQEREAFKMYQCMRKEGVDPDTFTIVSLLKACATMQDLAQGRIIHADACKKGLARENFVGNSLVSMYGKCGATFEAENAFLALSYRDTVSWTAMLSAYLEQGQSMKALQLFRQMQEEGVNASRLTCVIVLQTCVSFAETNEALALEGLSVKEVALEVGQALHAYARRKDLVSDAFVGTTLLNMYGNCGSIRMAENVFNMLSHKSIVSWNAMLAAYVDQSCGKEALLLFRQMLEEGMAPDHLTYVSAIQACSILAEKEAAIGVSGCLNKVILLKIGHALHADACMKDFEFDAFVDTALVTMYGKCGSIEEAEAVFNDLSKHDIVTWTALFSAYVEQGQGEKALELHREMQKQQMFLDHVTLMLSWTEMLSGFIEQGQGVKALELYAQLQEEGVLLDDVALNCVLQACCLTGSLESCKQVHFSIVCAGYDLLHSVAATLIHAYGNCGSVVDAQVIFDRLSEPDIVSWSACIAGHAGEGDLAACLYMFEKMAWTDIKPDGLTFSSILSVCCHAGLVGRGLEFFESMSKDFGVAPDLKHYGIILDLLGRAGDFSRIVKMLGSMPLQADLAIWMCLLGACRTHGNVELAKMAFDHAVNLQPKEGAAYVLMSNIYAEAGMQECVADIEHSRQRACAL
eukprot:c10244_g1_i1 orf=80-2863(+)